MNPFLLWLEATRLSVWTRESTSVLAYPTILSAHAIGMGLAAGINGTFALHLLGVAPGVPTPELRRFVPIMWFGFWINAASGVMLLIAYPTKALTNPVFYLKLSLIAGGMFLSTRVRRVFFDRASPALGLDRVSAAPDHTRAVMSSVAAGTRWLAIASLTCWSGAIISGRLLAYTYTRLFATW